MNDSFLEDLDLIPKTEKKKTQQQPDCHITTRNATSTPLCRFLEQDEKDNAVQLQMKYLAIPTNASTPDVKIIGIKDVASKEFNNKQDVRKHSTNAKISEKIKKVNDDREQSVVDVKQRLDNNKQQSNSREHKIRSQETRIQNLKVPENKTVNKGHKRYSESHKESTLTSIREKRRSSDTSNSHSPDVSSKENSRPSDSAKETGSRNLNKDKRKTLDESRRSSFKIADQDLAAIKELISTYTREESTKILHAMQEVYVSSTGTLLRQLSLQTDDLVKEMHFCTGKESDRIRTLIEENERLQSEVFGLRREVIGLRVRNEDLQNKLEDIEFLKQENAALKLQLR